MGRDEQIINALAELENIKYQLLDAKEYIENAIKEENKNLVKDCAKRTKRLSLITLNVSGLIISTIFCLAFINTLGIPTPYVHLAKGLPIGLQQMIFMYHKKPKAINYKYSKDDKLKYELDLSQVEVALAFIEESYKALFKELSLDAMKDIVPEFEYDPNINYLEENNTKTKSKVSRF